MIVIFVSVFFRKDIRRRGFRTRWGTLPPDPEAQQAASQEGGPGNGHDGGVPEDSADGRQIPEGHELVEELQERLSRIELELGFERTYRLIFGTQIRALKLLNESPLGLNDNGLQPLVDEHKERSNAAGWMGFSSLEEWLGFPLGWGLIDRDAATNTYYITDLGQGFLRYLVDERLAEDKAG